MKEGIRWLAAVLACLMLCGCTGPIKAEIEGPLTPMGDYVAYTDMVYERPRMEELERILQEACDTAQTGNVIQIMGKVNAFYDAYDAFYTHYSLADIRYSGDLTDAYWREETNFCAANSPRVEAMLEQLYYALARSPEVDRLESDKLFGAGYFDYYQGENSWDEALTTLMEEESALISRYYTLSEAGTEYEYGSEDYYDVCYEEMAQVLVDLIRVRHAIAQYWGYEDYSRFATNYYYYRDYTVAESREYLEEIRQELVALYRQVNRSDIWDDFVPTSEKQTYAYVEEMARNMGGTVAEAFELMDRAGLYDISWGQNKYPSSFEVYLTSYSEPFIFMCPEMTTYDHLTFAHEFGHFCNDYASGGSYAGVDVLEFFSQGMEYLSLCYVEGAEKLTKLKMADSLCLYVEQAAFASFEMQMYDIPREELSVQALEALYDRVAREYGFDSVNYDAREYVTVNHYYTNPLYILSYVVSNDAAMALYQMEQAQRGSGLACLEANLDTEEYYFLSFLNSAGLESPFAPGRIRQVRETFEEIFS